MEQKNGVQQTLLQSGIVFKIEENAAACPEIISEETFVELLELSSDDDDLPTDIMDQEYENDDLDDDDGLIFF